VNNNLAATAGALDLARAAIRARAFVQKDRYGELPSALLASLIESCSVEHSKPMVAGGPSPLSVGCAACWLEMSRARSAGRRRPAWQELIANHTLFDTPKAARARRVVVGRGLLVCVRTLASSPGKVFSGRDAGRRPGA
jgi:hypothetical protein